MSVHQSRFDQPEGQSSEITDESSHRPRKGELIHQVDPTKWVSEKQFSPGQIGFYEGLYISMAEGHLKGARLPSYIPGESGVSSGLWRRWPKEIGVIMSDEEDNQARAIWRDKKGVFHFLIENDPIHIGQRTLKTDWDISSNALGEDSDGRKPWWQGLSCEDNPDCLEMSWPQLCQKREKLGLEAGVQNPLLVMHTGEYGFPVLTKGLFLATDRIYAVREGVGFDLIVNDWHTFVKRWRDALADTEQATDAGKELKQYHERHCARERQRAAAKPKTVFDVELPQWEPRLMDIRDFGTGPFIAEMSPVFHAVDGNKWTAVELRHD